MSDPIRSYRDLLAWQKAMEIVQAVHEQAKRLPIDERFGLTLQLNRCAVSIPSNIAEGWGRSSTADYLRFLVMARGSFYDLSTQVEICARLRYAGEWAGISEMIDQTRRVLHGLIRSLEDSRGC